MIGARKSARLVVLATVTLLTGTGSVPGVWSAQGASQSASQQNPNGSSTRDAAQDKAQSGPTTSQAVVWVNTDSGVYHKAGSRYYGKTKHGKYMTEEDARKAGYRAAEKK